MRKNLVSVERLALISGSAIAATALCLVAQFGSAPPRFINMGPVPTTDSPFNPGREFENYDTPYYSNRDIIEDNPISIAIVDLDRQIHFIEMTLRAGMLIFTTKSHSTGQNVTLIIIPFTQYKPDEVTPSTFTHGEYTVPITEDGSRTIVIDFNYFNDGGIVLLPGTQIQSANFYRFLGHNPAEES